MKRSFSVETAITILSGCHQVNRLADPVANEWISYQTILLHFGWSTQKVHHLVNERNKILYPNRLKITMWKDRANTQRANAYLADDSLRDGK